MALIIIDMFIRAQSLLSSGLAFPWEKAELNGIIDAFLSVDILIERTMGLVNKVDYFNIYYT
jgi:hypothetical protein